LRIPELVAGFLLGFASLLVIFLLSSDIAAHYEVCETTKEGAKECARYGILGFAFREIGSALDSYNGLITAIATAFIAWFTLSLRQSTNRLWDAGERQLELLGETSAAQSRDMQASIATATKANELNRKNFESVHRPQIRIKHLILAADIWQNEPIVVTLACVNHGTSDALLQQVGLKYFVVRTERDLPIEPEIPAIFGAADERLQSGLNYTFPNINNGRILNPEENSAIQQGRARLFCVGYVSYLDVAQRMRITGFCRVLKFPIDATARMDNCRFQKFEDPDYEYED
jgi:hypothetical protein